jgi:probable phosphoglycerate mutase
MAEANEKIVYFVRHGESVANVSGIYQTPETPLTDRGREQARAIAERAKHIKFEKLVSSPLPRTRETAERIFETTGKQPEYSELFVERLKPKKLQGRKLGEPEADEMYKKWMASLHEGGPKFEDGETFNELVARIDKTLKFLEEQEANSMMVVTSGYFMKGVLARIIFGEDLTPQILKKLESRLKTENTGISIIKWGAYSRYRNEGVHWRVLVFNDHSHLG